MTDPSALLDTLNRRLLRELAAEPRITMSALARRVGMSAPAVTERVQRLEQAGVITGYRTDVSPAALGLPVTAFVRIRPTAGQLPRIAELAAATPEVSECHRISGDDCFLIKVHAGAIEDLETILDRFLDLRADDHIVRRIHAGAAPDPAHHRLTTAPSGPEAPPPRPVRRPGTRRVPAGRRVVR